MRVKLTKRSASMVTFIEAVTAFRDAPVHHHKEKQSYLRRLYELRNTAYASMGPEPGRASREHTTSKRRGA